jgi:urease accessory protein
MLEVFERSTTAREANGELWLPWDLRKRGRLRSCTADGRDIGLFLQRGEPLRDGEKLLTRCGEIIVVRAAAEDVASASSDDWLVFSRACYHLGNRHVPLQIEARRLRFQRDPVLQQLALLLGMQVVEESAPFHPEPGAYSSHGHDNHHRETGHQAATQSKDHPHSHG